jgi:hypothetical protein
MDAAVPGSFREIEHGRGLGVRQPDPAQVRVTGSQDGVGINVTAADVDYSLVNRVGGFGGEELKRD